MKKTLKHSMAVLVALAMLLVMAIPAFAAGHGSITINNAVAGHTYKAYQILAGNTANGKLSNIAWGNGITPDGQAALYSEYNLTEGNQTAEKVAEAVVDSTADTAATLGDSQAIRFANAVGTNVETSNGKTGTLEGTTYTISDLEDGYYLIVDEGNPASRYMIQLVGNAEVNNKADQPTVDKDIVVKADGTTADYNTAQIGDTETFKLTSSVPEYAGYKEYYLEFRDTLSKGLAYVDNSVTVKIGNTGLDPDTANNKNGYSVSATVNDDETTTLVIHLNDLVSREYTVGAPIVVTYSAVVDDDAVIGNAGNTNSVKVAYSHDPLQSGEGTPDNGDEEGGNDGLLNGESAASTTKTFVTELDLTKVIADTETPLEGAVFNVEASTINKVLITGTRFVEKADGTFYKLTDGTYTEKAPTEATNNQYDNTATKYAKEAYGNASVQETADEAFQVVSDTNGKVKVTGLKEGTYTITEVQAPDGYNKLANPITIVITSNINTISSADEFAWSATVDGEDVTTKNANGSLTYNIENKAGTILPSTGGIGTYIVVIAGLAIVAAGVILMTKRNKKEED